MRSQRYKPRPERSAVAMIYFSAAFALIAPILQPAQAQVNPGDALTGTGLATSAGEKAAPEKVEIERSAGDSEIADRLQRIFNATGWFSEVAVEVDEGVVFLKGRATDTEAKEWAGNLARRTQDVVAVVNLLELEQPPMWNLAPAAQGLRDLWHDAIFLLPFIVFGLLILVLACLAAWITAMGMRRFLESRLSSRLLLNVLARAIGLMVLLLGVYIVLRISGLTRLALTVMGGTGILGLVIGIAFRDITENFLASVLLSMRRPFLTGDLVEVVSIVGYVQQLTTRATVLMTLDGNHVEIPNSVIYKNTIRNFSTNKNRRVDFTVGIGYDVAISDAQEIALRVLRDHPAVLGDPKPWALVDSLGSAVVVMRVYFWLDSAKHSWLKVKSSVIRHVKRAFQDSGIDMPDEAREVVFPRGIPVQLSRSRADDVPSRHTQAAEDGRATPGRSPAEPITTSAEDGLSSESEEIEQQAGQSRNMHQENLLVHGRNRANG